MRLQVCTLARIELRRTCDGPILVRTGTTGPAQSEVIMMKSLINTSHGQVAFRQSQGNGRPVILVHGNSMSSESYDRQLTADIARRWRFVAFDFPGHGDSPRPSDPERTYSIRGYAEIVRELSAALGLERPVVVGHSLGGNVALEIAGLGAELAGVMVFSTPPIRGPADIPEAFQLEKGCALFFRARLTEDEIATMGRLIMPAGVEPPPYYARSITATDPLARERIGIAISSADSRLCDERQVLSEARCPMAVVVGALDRIVNIDFVRRQSYPRLWRGSVQTIAGVAHNPQYDAADVFNPLLGDFLESAFA